MSTIQNPQLMMKYKLHMENSTFYTKLFSISLLLLSFMTLPTLANSASFNSKNSITADFLLSNTTVCLGSSITLQDASTGTGMTSWFWSFGAGASVASFNGQVPPTISYSTPGLKSITLTVVDNNSIPYSVVKTVQVNGVIADAGSNKNYCANSIPGVQLGTSPTAGATYAWLPATGLSSTSTSAPLASPGITTTYTVTVTESGCITTSSVVVTVLSAATVNAGRDTLVCNNASVQIGGASQVAYTYSWNPSAGLSNASISNPVATPLSNTVYTVVATAPNGCSAFDQIAINNLGMITANAGPSQTICNGAIANLGGAAQVLYSYSWAPSTGLSATNIANPAANPSVTTTYTLTTSALNCTSTATTVVTVNQLPVVNVGANDTINTCPSTGNILGGASVAGFTYVWSPSTFLSGTTTASVITTPTNDLTYTLTVTDLNNCTASANVFVNVYTGLSAHAGLDQTVCFGNAVALGGTSVVSTGGSGNYIFSWTPAATLNNASIAHPTALPIDTTIYILNVQDAAGANCGSGSDTVIVFVNPLPHPVLNFKTIYCTGDPIEPLVANPSGGTFFIHNTDSTIVYLNNNTFDPNSSMITPGVPYTITYSYTTPSGCTYDTSQSVIVFASPTANAGSDLAFCPVGGFPSVTLNGSGGNSYSWAPSTGLSNPNSNLTVATPSATTTYVLTVTSNGCVDFDTVLVSVCTDTVPTIVAHDDNAGTIVNLPLLIPVLVNDTSSIDITDHISITILATPKHGIAIGQVNSSNNGINYYPTNGFVGLDSFTYILCDTLMIKPYCDTAKVYVTIRPIANDDEFGSTTNGLPCGETVIDVLTNDYIGKNNDLTVRVIDKPLHGQITIISNTLHFVSEEGYNGSDVFTYEIKVNGMTDTARVVMEINCIPCVIPNGISPNGDVTNQFFVIDCITNYPGNELTIFNRWGNEVYHSKNYQNNWDAKYQGKDLPDGTYFYHIQFNDGVTKDKSGYVIVHR